MTFSRPPASPTAADRRQVRVEARQENVDVVTAFRQIEPDYRLRHVTPVGERSEQDARFRSSKTARGRRRRTAEDPGSDVAESSSSSPSSGNWSSWTVGLALTVRLINNVDKLRSFQQMHIRDGFAKGHETD